LKRFAAVRRFTRQGGVQDITQVVTCIGKSEQGAPGSHTPPLHNHKPHIKERAPIAKARDYNLQRHDRCAWLQNARACWL